MELSSYNVNRKRILAKCCFAGVVQAMWLAKEEGDSEREKCAREKSLELAVLINALEGWKPIISFGFKKVYTLTIDSGNFIYPLFTRDFILNGASTVGNTSYIPTGNNETFFRVHVDKVNGHPKEQDDTHQLTASYDGAVATLTAYSKFDDISLVYDAFSGSGVVATIVVGDTTPYVSTEVGCLSEIQIEKILNKIEALCGCDLNSMSGLIGTDTTINVIGSCNC